MQKASFHKSTAVKNNFLPKKEKNFCFSIVLLYAFIPGGEGKWYSIYLLPKKHTISSCIVLNFYKKIFFWFIKFFCIYKKHPLLVVLEKKKPWYKMCIFYKILSWKKIYLNKKSCHTQWIQMDGRTDGRTDRMNDNDIRFSTKMAKSYWHLRHPENGYGHTQFQHTFVHSSVRPFVCPSVYYRVFVTSKSQVNVFMHINWLVKLKLKWYRKYAAFFQRIIGNCLWRCFLFRIKQLTPLFLYSANNFLVEKIYNFFLK